MKLAPQPVRRSLRAKPAPLMSIFARCARERQSPDWRRGLQLSLVNCFRYRSRLPLCSLFSLSNNSSDLDPAMQNATPVSPFRINTCKSVSKQRTLTTFRINTYEKRGEGGGGTNWNLRDTLAVAITCATWRLYLL